MLASRPKVHNSAEELSARYENQFIGLMDRSTSEITPVRVLRFTLTKGVLSVTGVDGQTYVIGDEFDGNSDIVPIWDAPKLGWTQTRNGAYYVKSNTGRQYLRGFHHNLMLFHGRMTTSKQESKEYLRLLAEYKRRQHSGGELDSLYRTLMQMQDSGKSREMVITALQLDKMTSKIAVIAPFFYAPKFVDSAARLARVLKAGKSAALNHNIAIIPALENKSPDIVMFNDNEIGTFVEGVCYINSPELFNEFFPDWIKVENAVRNF